MGLIKAVRGAIGSVLADQWEEFFYCDALPANVLAVKGKKKTSGRSANTRADNNVISNGSVIAVADGQCMIIVEQGKVVELCAEPGEFTYDTSSEPSIFYGDLSQTIPSVLKNMGERFTFGGQTAKDQRIYFFNTKELMGNKYGTANPVPFKVHDANINLSLLVSIRCFGEYSYRITNPALFYANVCGNVSDSFTRDKIDSQLKSELLTALQPAFASISAKGIDYTELPGHTLEIAAALNEQLSAQWRDKRGIEIVAFGVSSVTASEEDEKRIKDLQTAAVMRDPNMAAAVTVNAQADAMRTAAGNTNGAMAGFVGVNMAGAMGGMNAGQLFQMGAQQQTAASAAAPAAGGWKCSCGAVATGKFCPECGAPRPAPAQGWTCSCGAVNTGKFCAECGAKKPAGAPIYKCDKCGWVPPDPANPPKFCPECGDLFDDNDKQ